MSFPEYFSKGRLKFGYLGIKDGQRIFRISYNNAMPSQTDRSLQALILVNVETKSIQHIDVTMLHLKNGLVITTNMDCQRLIEPTMTPIQQPLKIHWRFEDPETDQQIEVKLTNCRIKHKASLYRQQ